MAADPNELEREAQDAEREAVEDAQQAKALAASNNPDDATEARRLENDALYRTMYARRKRRQANDLRARIDTLNRQITEKQSALDDKRNEKSGLGSAELLIGAAVRSETRAREHEKQMAMLAQRDDPYSQSQLQKLEQDYQHEMQEAEDRRREAGELEARHVEIDKEISRLEAERSDLENQINLL